MVALHLRRCEECRAETETFHREREWVRETGDELPGGLRWDRLAAEMKANIQVGLAAGECVSTPKPQPQPLGWRVAAALASIALVVVSGWWLQMPNPRVASSFDNGEILIEETAEGIEIRGRDERGLALLHPAETVTVSVSVEGAMAARFIDDETGLVTINHVYMQ
ncbi:MAG: hypothetical protein GY953_37795 [bacterium]|nr:hypothetical protein [bacterium]